MFKFDFIGNRKYFFILSALIILSGIIGCFARGGFVQDIQFQGGTEIVLQMTDENYDLDKVVDSVSTAINKRVQAQKASTFNAANNNEKINLLIVKVASAEALSSEDSKKVQDAIKAGFSVKEGSETTVNKVSPTIGKELMTKGLTAVLVTAILTVLYIWIRFSMMGVFAGFAAIIAVIHDVAVMLSFYAVFGIPMNESFIAAVLTILGYSVNDTIVIFDRIRENSKLSRKDTIAGLVNKSIWQSLSRSINTTATTLICVSTIYVFASMNNIESIQEFTMPLMVGLVSGTYSTIFIASQIWVMWKESQAKKKLAEKTA